jgi:hypothetical protein
MAPKTLAALLRSYSLEDYDTCATLTRRGEKIADVTMIREACDLIELVHEAADMILTLRDELEETKRELENSHD